MRFIVLPHSRRQLFWGSCDKLDSIEEKIPAPVQTRLSPTEPLPRRQYWSSGGSDGFVPLNLKYSVRLGHRNDIS